MNGQSTQPCPVCPRHCAPAEGQRGFCRARVARAGRVVPAVYGAVSSLALDPIEKKPLHHFHPGGHILSVGGYGCNMRCPFCQNHEISQTGGEADPVVIQPEELVKKAEMLLSQGNIGLAFTYNEPVVGFEYVRDTAFLAKSRGLACAMVTNGFFCADILTELLPAIDAFNIDLKCFTAEGYRRLSGELCTVMDTIARLVPVAHVEVTWLVAPGFSDGEEDVEQAAKWLAGLSTELPLHLSRFFPRWQVQAEATPLPVMHRLRHLAQRHLRHVHLGNC